MATGPMIELPVFLLKTCSAVLTIWTYCVAPTSPFVSGGAQLQLTPGKPIPSKFRTADGIFGAAGRFCTTGSTRSCRTVPRLRDRKSTRLNSSHLGISYAVFCLKKKKEQQNNRRQNQCMRAQDVS